jgi:hypothetical protein
MLGTRSLQHAQLLFPIPRRVLVHTRSQKMDVGSEHLPRGRQCACLLEPRMSVLARNLQFVIETNRVAVRSGSPGAVAPRTIVPATPFRDHRNVFASHQPGDTDASLNLVQRPAAYWTPWLGLRQSRQRSARRRTPPRALPSTAPQHAEENALPRVGCRKSTPPHLAGRRTASRVELYGTCDPYVLATRGEQRTQSEGRRDPPFPLLHRTRPVSAEAV